MRTKLSVMLAVIAVIAAPILAQAQQMSQQQEMRAPAPHSVRNAEAQQQRPTMAVGNNVIDHTQRRDQNRRQTIIVYPNPFAYDYDQPESFGYAGEIAPGYACATNYNITCQMPTYTPVGTPCDCPTGIGTYVDGYVQ